MENYNSGCVYVVESNERQITHWTTMLNRCGWRVQAFADNTLFTAAYRELPMECVVVGQSIAQSIALIREVKSLAWRVPVIAAVGQAELDQVVELMRIGACDVLFQPISDDVLAMRVAEALRLNAESKKDDVARQNLRNALSPREQEVLDLLLDAATTTSIARRLDISPKTVEKHRLHIMEKLNVDSVPQLMRLMFRLPTKRIS